MAKKYNISTLVSEKLNIKKQKDKNSPENKDKKEEIISSYKSAVPKEIALEKIENEGETASQKVQNNFSILIDKENENKNKNSQNEEPVINVNKEDYMSSNQLVEKLNEIKNQEEAGDFINAPETLNLEKMKIPETTNEEIISLAKESLEKKYNQDKKQTNNNFSKKISSVLESQARAKENMENTKNRLRKFIIL